MPSPFSTAHTFCASRNGPRNSDFLRTVPIIIQSFFGWLMTMREKKILARPADGILKEKWPVVSTHCSDKIKLQFENKNAIHCYESLLL